MAERESKKTVKGRWSSGIEAINKESSVKVKNWGWTEDNEQHKEENIA